MDLMSSPPWYIKMEIKFTEEEIRELEEGLEEGLKTLIPRVKVKIILPSD